MLLLIATSLISAYGQDYSVNLTWLDHGVYQDRQSEKIFETQFCDKYGMNHAVYKDRGRLSELVFEDGTHCNIIHVH